MTDSNYIIFYVLKLYLKKNHFYVLKRFLAYLCVKTIFKKKNHFYVLKRFLVYLCVKTVFYVLKRFFTFWEKSEKKDRFYV